MNKIHCEKCGQFLSKEEERCCEEMAADFGNPEDVAYLCDRCSREMNNPPCEVCGTHGYTYEELLHLMDDDSENGEFAGMDACPDCVFEIRTMHRNPITKESLK